MRLGSVTSFIFDFFRDFFLKLDFNAKFRQRIAKISLKASDVRLQSGPNGLRLPGVSEVGQLTDTNVAMAGCDRCLLEAPLSHFLSLSTRLCDCVSV